MSCHPAAHAPTVHDFQPNLLPTRRPRCAKGGMRRSSPTRWLLEGPPKPADAGALALSCARELSAQAIGSNCRLKREDDVSGVPPGASGGRRSPSGHDTTTIHRRRVAGGHRASGGRSCGRCRGARSPRCCPAARRSWFHGDHASGEHLDDREVLAYAQLRANTVTWPPAARDGLGRSHADARR